MTEDEKRAPDEAAPEGTGSCKISYCGCTGFHEGKISGFCDSSNNNGGTCGHRERDHN